MAKQNPLQRYIKDKTGNKVPMSPTSVNLTADHDEFLEEKDLNLSQITRDAIDGLIQQSGWKPRRERKGN